MISQEFRVLMPDNSSTYVTLMYSDTDPWAIHMSFGGDNNWIFARNLLVVGLERPVGMADVRVWPGERSIYMALESPEGRSLLRFYRTQLRKFVYQTRDLVPLGTESVDMDLVISEIFKEEMK